MVLLTGATGRVGTAVRTRLLARGEVVRCMVRDPRRLGADRVRVQIALGDLAEPASIRHALRGVRAVVHLGAAWRDQAGASLEEINGLATWRLLRAAEAAGAERFVFLSPLGATPEHPLRVQRAKALAERAVLGAALDGCVLRASLIYELGDRRARLPLRAGRGRATVQPIWAGDVADCVLAVLSRRGAGGVHELAGPEAMSWRTWAHRVARRSALPVPARVLRPALRGYEALTGPAALLTWDEAAQATIPLTTGAGTAGARGLGVRPRALGELLG